MNIRSLVILGVFATACGAQKTALVSDRESVRIFSQIVTKNLPSSVRPFSSDPLESEQWHFRNFGQTSSKGIRGLPGADIRLDDLAHFPNDSQPDVVIAIIDSGIELSHVDFDFARITSNPGESGHDETGNDKSRNGKDDDLNGMVDDHGGWNFADNTADTTDTLGHGTHVAGLLLARSHNALGIFAPWKGLKVLPLQIFSSKRPAPSAETIAAAIRYAVDRGAHVISASFGTPSYSEAMRSAVEYALKRDVIFVSAVGNFRKNQETEPSFPAGFNLENQISVGATERRDLAAHFSNFGSSVDLFAPGEEILSLGLNNTYVVRSGTSQAAPLVAAAAATARLLYPHAPAPEIKRIVLDSADEILGLTGFSRTARRLNVANILRRESGLRQKIFNFEKWSSQPVQIETEHPYRANLREEKFVSPPEGSLFMRLEFNQFITQSTDTLEIIDQNNRVVALFSGSLGSFWTPVFPAQRLRLRFTTDHFVSDFGWKISQIQYTD